MGVSGKGKRTIVVQGQKFYWYVAPDSFDKRFAKSLHVVSSNKDFILVYRLNPVTEGSPFPKLQVLQSNGIATGFYNFRQEEHDEIITPKLVSEIIRFVIGPNIAFSPDGFAAG